MLDKLIRTLTRKIPFTIRLWWCEKYTKNLSIYNGETLLKPITLNEVYMEEGGMMACKNGELTILGTLTIGPK